MPRITFLIGNGFDRQLGLDTGYDQFLRWYISQPSRSENIKQYKEQMANNPSSPWWSDAEIAIGEHLSVFTSSTIKDYYERIRDFKLELIEYLLAQEKACDYSDVILIGDGFAEFLTDFHKDILLQNKTGNLFSKRENTEYNFINFNYTDTLEQIINITENSRVYGKLYETKLDPSHTVSGRFGTIIAVHGTLKSSIIMGVNDETQLSISADNITPKLKRTVIKSETNAALGRPEELMASYLIGKSDIIAIYGLKLGETDKKWRTALYNWLKEGEHKIVLFGHKRIENANPIIPEDILDFVDEKQTEFLQKLTEGHDQEQFELLRDRILIIDKTQHLNFCLVPKQELAEVM